MFVMPAVLAAVADARQADAWARSHMMRQARAPRKADMAPDAPGPEVSKDHSKPRSNLELRNSGRNRFFRSTPNGSLFS
jgi:hypothetical protein